jgi:hypothetical protein
MDLSIKQVVLFQRVHQVPGGHRIDSQPLREPALIEARLVVESGKHGKLKGREVLGLRYLCKHTEAYLMEPSCKMRGHAMNGRDCRPRRAGYRKAGAGWAGLTGTGNEVGHLNRKNIVR